MTGYPIPTTVPVTPLPPREPKPEWPGWTGVRRGEDHTTRTQGRTVSDREQGDVEP